MASLLNIGRSSSQFSWSQFRVTATLQCRGAYWPPPRSKRSRLIALPSGKQVFVFNVKRDEDGQYEAAVVFLDTEFNKLTYLVEEEFKEFVKLVPRLRRYMDVWGVKADEELKKVEQTRNPNQIDYDDATLSKE